MRRLLWSAASLFRRSAVQSAAIPHRGCSPAPARSRPGARGTGCLHAEGFRFDWNRIESLLRGGNLYLSLQDAIALALENNLDVELQRFGPRFVETDLLRSKGGGALRGIPLTASEPPPGLGG